MREDYQEELDRMFGDGFVIAYIMPNKDLGFYYSNPKNDELLVFYLMAMDKLLEMGNRGEMRDRDIGFKGEEEEGNA